MTTSLELPADLKIGPSRTPADYLRKVSALPPTPRLVVSLLEVFREPNQDVDRIVSLISCEPVVTAEILKRCNSVYFMGQEPVADIFEAISRLGFYEVYCLVTAMFASQARTMAPRSTDLDPERFWKHSVSVAFAAAAIAEETDQPRPLAFTAGLLHDIGKLVFASSEPARYPYLLKVVGPDQRNFPGAEGIVFGVNHAEVAGELMTRWELPDEVVCAVRYHHNEPVTSPCPRLAATVRLADLTAYRVSDGPSTQQAEELADSLELPRGALGRLTEATRSGLERVSGLV